MTAANPARGEAALRVAGEALVIRPSFTALVAAEGELGPLFALVERAAEAERYRVTLVAADGTARSVECDAPTLAIAAADWATIVRAEVRQRGTGAESRAAMIGGGDTA